MSSTTLPVCPKTGSTSPSLTVHLCLHTVPGNRECAHRPWAYVGIRTKGSLNEPERWEELRAWVVEHLPRFQNVIDPRLERIMGESATEDKAAAGGPDT